MRFSREDTKGAEPALGSQTPSSRPELFLPPFGAADTGIGRCPRRSPPARVEKPRFVRGLHEGTPCDFGSTAGTAQE